MKKTFKQGEPVRFKATPAEEYQPGFYVRPIGPLLEGWHQVVLTRQLSFEISAVTCELDLFRGGSFAVPLRRLQKVFGRAAPLKELFK